MKKLGTLLLVWMLLLSVGFVAFAHEPTLSDQGTHDGIGYHNAYMTTDEVTYYYVHGVRHKDRFQEWECIDQTCSWWKSKLSLKHV